MKTLTYDLICSFKPCYDPIKHIPKDYSESIVDFLKREDIPAKDRLWVAVRSSLLSDKQLHLYGVACARSCEDAAKDYPKVKACNDTVERFLKGEVTKAELSAARSAAESATWSAARSVARSVARSAAWSARSAAESAESAAWSAAQSAARSATWSATWSTRSVARSAAEEKQCQLLIDILKASI